MWERWRRGESIGEIDRALDRAPGTIFCTLKERAGSPRRRGSGAGLRGAKGMNAGQGRIRDAISIRERPAEVEDRSIPGHREGDLLAGSANTHIATIVERHSRFMMLVRVEGKDTQTVVAALTHPMGAAFTRQPLSSTQRCVDAFLGVYGVCKVWWRLAREDVKVARCTVEPAGQSAGIPSFQGGCGFDPRTRNLRQMCRTCYLQGKGEETGATGVEAAIVASGIEIRL
jgi:hypothetical protein